MVGGCPIKNWKIAQYYGVVEVSVKVGVGGTGVLVRVGVKVKVKVGGIIVGVKV